MSWRIAVDIGGTFTDLVAISQPGGDVVRAKSLTTPARLVDGVLNAIQRAGLRAEDASDVVHGSTIAINAILEQRGARTALLTTRGFRDVLEMGRKSRPDMYNLFFRPRLCLIPRDLRLEVDERVTFDGQVLHPIDEGELRAAIDSLPADIESIAICFLHSYAHPEHEIEVARIAAGQRPHVYVTSSTAVSGEFREYERTSTAAANAYVGPLVSTYLGDLRDALAKDGFSGPLLITQSNGGVMTAGQAMLQPIRTTESGPAAGVNGAAWLGRELGIANLIAFDMGGTTAKACVVIDGVPESAPEYYIGGPAHRNTGPGALPRDRRGRCRRWIHRSRRRRRRPARGPDQRRFGPGPRLLRLRRNRRDGDRRERPGGQDRLGFPWEPADPAPRSRHSTRLPG